MPAQIGPYRVDRQIGRGGMGVVYLARDTRLDRDVAIKALPTELADDPDRLVRFEREARLLASLNHPNIGTIYGLEEFDGRRYLVLEYVGGESLAEFVSRAPSWRTCVEVAASIAEALAAAHASGVVHRDIKPDNVLFTTNGVVKILDFGLALPVPASDGTGSEGTTIEKKTLPGTVLGTPGYMSPEQVRGRPADPRSDIFSFGCLLHEMLTRRPTFARDTVADSMAATLRDEPVKPVDSGVKIPADLDRIVMRCLEKEPSERFQSARDLAYAIRGTVVDTAGSPALEVTPRRKTWIAGAAVLGVILMAGLAWVLAPMLTGGGANQRGGTTVHPAGADDADISNPRVDDRSSDASAELPRLAVLPFDIIGDAPDAAFLADEVPASVIDTVSTLSSVSVVPRASSYRYRDNAEDVATIGRALDADFVLTGQITVGAASMRVRAELVDVVAGTQSWSDRFDESLADTVALEAEITRRIAEALRLEITGEEQATLERRRPVNPEAHATCLEGRYWWSKRTPDGLQRAVELYQQAVRLDQEYARAHAELGNAYLMQAVYSHPPIEVLPKAYEALQRAIELDPTLPDPYAGLGCYHIFYRWDVAAAEASLKRALEVDPDSVLVNHWYSVFLRSRARWDEAREYIDRAVKLDPGNIIVRHDQGNAAVRAWDFQAAAEVYQRVVEMAPTFQLTLGELGVSKYHLGERDEAIELLRECVTGDGACAYQLGLLGAYLAYSGRRVEALEELERVNELSRRRYVPPNAYASIYAGLGDADRMFEMLEHCIDERVFIIAWLHQLPEFTPYFEDPRFEAFHRRHGIPVPDVRYPDLGLEPPRPTIAVLPFEMPGADDAAAYLADEIPASVLEALAKISFLHVIPRSSSFRHRDSTRTIPEIGGALEADFILTGQVLPIGDELRIRAELVDVRSNRQLFADRIDRSLSDTLAVETEVTGKIVDVLMLPVTDRESRRLAARRPVNAHAHAAYLKGMFWWHRPSPENLLKALDEFHRATTLDPDYALACLGTAVTYSSLSVFMLPPRETVPKSIAALERALELDPNLADAYHARAWHEMTWNRDWDAAERDIKESIRLNPRNSIAHFIYGWWHVGRGELDQALSELEQACQLDPGSAVHGSDLGLIRVYAGRFEDARIAIQDALEVDPKSPKAQIGLVLLDSLQGFHDQAIGRARQMEEEGLLFPDYYAFLGDALVRAGRTAEARDFLSELLDRRRDSFVPATEIATIYGALEESESAMQWLETAFEERSPMLFHRLLTYEWHGLRSTPRFRDLAQRVGVDPDWVAPGVVRSALDTN